MSRRDILKFEGWALAWQRALAQAGVTLDDMSFAEVHDCFTIAELMVYEAMGLAPQGQGARAIEERHRQRKTASCRSIRPAASKPRAIRSARPACRCTRSPRCSSPARAGDMQVKGAKLGGIFNMGGAAVANYVSILERLR